MSTPPEPTTEEAIALFKSIEDIFPKRTLGEDKWYLPVVSALVGAEPRQVGTLYTYLINKPESSSPASRQALVRRLREALVESISILGVVRPIESLISIVQVEREEDKDYSFSREGWQTGPENLARGEKWLKTIYAGNLEDATRNFIAHKDFDFISREITYGLYLSDHSILGPVETELVVLSGIMIQNMPLQTAWHLRGIRRIGVSAHDVELVQQCVDLVAKFAGVGLYKIPRVAEVENQV